MDPASATGPVRLQKVLARAGVASRRAAEAMILAGRVTVDGQAVTVLGTRVGPREVVAVDGRPLAGAEPFWYVLLNKPIGYLSSRHDPQGRPVVTALVAEIPARLFPVGRLDWDTEGALLLTNDGELAHRVLHPSHEVEKTYQAWVAGSPSPAALDRLAAGIEIEGRRTWPARLAVLAREPDATLVEITIHEGRKRQVRKMFAATGHPVQQLRRTAYGQLALAGLPEGSYRVLGPAELALIFLRKK
ncbi:MAG: pseudouridine synthase [Thermodesulfobacteriota bacterium]